MRTGQLLAAFVVFVACGKSAQSDKLTPGGSLTGVYRVESITVEGKDMVLADLFRQSLKGDGNQEVDVVRMTLEVKGGTITVGLDQVWGSPGSATYCSVHGSTDADMANGKLTIPTIEAVASAGVVTTDGGDTSKDTAKCNVSFKKGTYDIALGAGKAELSTMSDGKPVTMHLVADDEVIDLKARAVAFAKRK